ncbi:MAG TPA: hypothetical protein VMD74_00130 [Candidatus Methylomirabilis sp.]|nr:hypothetical protein [Candidatus Methylomirabilis sp.]
MDQNANSMEAPKVSTPLNSKKKETIYFVAGIALPLINVVLSYFKVPLARFFNDLVVLSVIVAIVFLFIKKYRQIGKKYLFGILIAIIASAIFGFAATFIIVAMKK